MISVKKYSDVTIQLKLKTSLLRASLSIWVFRHRENKNRQSLLDVRRAHALFPSFSSSISLRLSVRYKNEEEKDLIDRSEREIKRFLTDCCFNVRKCNIGTYRLLDLIDMGKWHLVSNRKVKYVVWKCSNNSNNTGGPCYSLRHISNVI